MDCDGSRRRIGASIRACNLATLKQDSTRLLEIGVDFLQVELMDGNFVPEFTYGPPVVGTLRDLLGADVRIDVHLLCNHSQRYLKELAVAGADSVTLQFEAMESAAARTDALATIRQLEMRAALAILPRSSVQLLLPYCDSIDAAVVLTADPAQPKGRFDSAQLAKVRRLREEGGAALTVAVSGDVGPANAAQCASAGANSFVVGAAAFAGADPEATVAAMLRRVAEQMSERRGRNFSFTEYYQMDGVQGESHFSHGASETISPHADT